jgi:hypothetical protein
VLRGLVCLPTQMKGGFFALFLVLVASCDKEGATPDAGAGELCCVRGTTRTLREACEPAETAEAASSCAARPDAGVTRPSVVTCGDGRLDLTDECDGASGCSDGECVNCACVLGCPAAPSPNPDLLCARNEDCPEGNGLCYACRCSARPAATLTDPAGDAPPDIDMTTVSLGVEGDGVSVSPRFGTQGTPFLGQRVCLVEYTQAELVAEVCFFVQGNLKAELRTAAGVRPLATTEFGGMFGSFIGVKRSVFPLAAGHAVFVYTRTETSAAIADRFPDKGGISVDRLLGTR